MNLKIRLFIATTSLAFSCFASQPQEMPELKTVFDRFNVSGSILIYDRNTNSYMGYDLERCNAGFCSVSTFKIPNTLIAFETGIATPETVFKWNGESREIAGWERDFTVAEAFSASVVPVYQEIARRIGVDDMKYYARLFDYGDLDINRENIDKFWLEGNSTITQYQQI